MKINIKKLGVVSLSVIVVGLVAARLIGPSLVEDSLNPRITIDHSQITPEAKSLHSTLTIMDWHADSLLWDRDLLSEAERGKVDLPRLQKGNFSLQMLTTVTKSPEGQNYVENDAGSDTITKLAILQGWPVKSWSSLLERALYQADKLANFVDESEGRLSFIKSATDLEKQQQSPKPNIGLLLGTEGAHPLEGKLSNIDTMFEAGFRMFGLTHFFDNELGGSLHGTSEAGLTDFGRAAVKRMDELEIIIDLAHASERMAIDVLELSSRPQVVSHTGLKGACNTPRNYPDDLMKAIAEKGGLIAIGFWDAAVCDASPMGIAKVIQYGILLVGADHIALGSDWDGAVKTIAADDIIAVTDALIKLGVSEADIRKVMGENSVNFLARWLPKT